MDLHEERVKKFELQSDIRALEQVYNTGKLDTLEQDLEEQKEQVVNEMLEYAKNHQIVTKYDKDGLPIAYATDLNPITISNMFFKPITPIRGQEPIYNAEKLGMVFDYYNFLVANINDKIGTYPPSLKSFCAFAGLTSSSLRRYKNCDDLSLRNVANKIYDQFEDDNITMAQLGMIREKSTIFKMETQNEVSKTPQTNVNINASIVDIDLDKINERLDKYSQFARKKIDNEQGKSK